jgi:HlyD family secretion protein
MANHRGGSWLKWLIILLLLGGAAAGGVWYYQKANSEAPQYQTAAVTRGDLVQTVTATGQLNPVVNVQVGSQVSGRIDKIMVDYNSQVKSNQVIAEIDPSTYKAALLRAEAEAANAKANSDLARIQAQRAESMFTNKLISASDHDTALAQSEQAAAQLKISEAAVETAKVDLSRCTIFAPVDGVVISRNVDVGQTVASSFNTPTLFLIANDLTKMQIDALVSEADIGGVHVDQDVNFQVDAYPYRTFHGKVKQIRYGAVTNQNVVNYDCVVAVNNDDSKLLPGMTANLSVVIASETNCLRIPNAALRFRPPEVAAAAMTNAPNANTTNSARTNGPIEATGRGEVAQRGGGERGPGGGGESFRKGPGGGGRGGGGGGGRDREQGGGGPGAGQMRPKPERAGPRTVYLLAQENGKPELKPVRIRTGITDGVNTEVLEGLQEGDQVVSGLLTIESGSSGAGGKRPSNPFGGGFRRF